MNRRRLQEFCICLAVSFLLFGISIMYGFTQGDDQYLVVTNVFAHGVSLRNIVHVFSSYDPELYIPMTFLSYQLNYLIAGLHPAFYHLTNVFLHGISGFLLLELIRKYSSRSVVAWVAAVLFLIHPLQVESVVWISGRKDLLSTALTLGSLLLLLQYSRNGRKTAFLGSIILFMLALLSKASVMTVPVIVTTLLLLHERASFHRTARVLLPFFLLAAIFGAIAWLGKGRVVHAASVMETMLMATRSIAFYFEKFVLPFKLSPAYAYHGPIQLSVPAFAYSVVFCSVVGVIALTSLRLSRSIFLSLSAFLILLAPTFLNFHKGEIAYIAVDRYVYLPSIALFILVGIAVDKLVSKVEKKTYVWVPLGLIIVSLLTLTGKQVWRWRSDEVLLGESLKHYPDSIPLRISLALIYRETGKKTMEKRVLEGGLELREDVAYRVGLGSIALREGNDALAEEHFLKAKLLDEKNPEPLFYLASLREKQGKIDEALKLYTEAYSIDESYVAAINNAGAIELDRGNLQEAEEIFTHAIEWNPSFMEGLYNLYQVLAMQKRRDEGYPYLQRAYELAPENKDIALSFAYEEYERGNLEASKKILKELLGHFPDERTALRLLDLVQKDLKSDH